MCFWRPFAHSFEDLLLTLAVDLFPDQTSNNHYISLSFNFKVFLDIVLKIPPTTYWYEACLEICNASLTKQKKLVVAQLPELLKIGFMESCNCPKFCQIFTKHLHV